MKLKIDCPKCGSDNVVMAENVEGVTPMYKCNDCGYKRRLFPKFESDKNEESEE